MLISIRLSNKWTVSGSVVNRFLFKSRNCKRVNFSPSQSGNSVSWLQDSFKSVTVLTTDKASGKKVSLFLLKSTQLTSASCASFNTASGICDRPRPMRLSNFMLRIMYLRWWEQNTSMKIIDKLDSLHVVAKKILIQETFMQLLIGQRFSNYWKHYSSSLEEKNIILFISYFAILVWKFRRIFTQQGRVVSFEIRRINPALSQMPKNAPSSTLYNVSTYIFQIIPIDVEIAQVWHDSNTNGYSGMTKWRTN